MMTVNIFSDCNCVVWKLVLYIFGVAVVSDGDGDGGGGG